MMNKVRVIRDRLKATQDRQKSYVDLHRREINYKVGDKVFLKVSPWKGTIHFDKKGKLNQHFIGPYEVIEKIGPVAYRLSLLSKLSQVHNVFHVSMLKRYRSDPNHVITSQLIEVQDDLSYIEKPM